MSLSKENVFDEDIKNFIKQVADVCLSEEFTMLRRELETLYFQRGADNASAAAFQDALLALLAENAESINKLQLWAN